MAPESSPKEPAGAPPKALTILGSAAIKLRDAAVAMGLSADELAHEAGIDFSECASPEHRLPFDALLRLWQSALDRVQDPSLPIVVAQQYAPGDYELLGFVASSCDSLRSALPLVQRYMRLWNEAGAWQLHEGVAGDLELEYVVTGPAAATTRCSVESGVAEIVHAARAATGKPIAPRVVRFAHRAPRSVAAHEAFFGCAVAWHAGATRVVFRGEDLGHPLIRADASLASFLRKQADARMATLPKVGAVAERVRTHVSAILARGEPSLEIIAERLGVTVRTLRRDLDREKVSFRTLVDEVRREWALELVSDPRIPMVQVSLLLGYSEQSPFHRAFRRWTGGTPAEARRAALERAPAPPDAP